MKLVDDYRQAWRWLSVQALAAIALLPLVWTDLPPDVKAMLPEGWRPWVLVALALAGILGRLKAQVRP